MYRKGRRGNDNAEGVVDRVGKSVSWSKAYRSDQVVVNSGIQQSQYDANGLLVHPCVKFSGQRASWLCRWCKSTEVRDLESRPK